MKKIQPFIISPALFRNPTFLSNHSVIKQLPSIYKVIRIINYKVSVPLSLNETAFLDPIPVRFVLPRAYGWNDLKQEWWIKYLPVGRWPGPDATDDVIMRSFTMDWDEMAVWEYEHFFMDQLEDVLRAYEKIVPLHEKKRINTFLFNLLGLDRSYWTKAERQGFWTGNDIVVEHKYPPLDRNKWQDFMDVKRHIMENSLCPEGHLITVMKWTVVMYVKAYAVLYVEHIERTRPFYFFFNKIQTFCTGKSNLWTPLASLARVDFWNLAIDCRLREINWYYKEREWGPNYKWLTSHIKARIERLFKRVNSTMYMRDSERFVKILFWEVCIVYSLVKEQVEFLSFDRTRWRRYW